LANFKKVAKKFTRLHSELHSKIYFIKIISKFYHTD
jgi:hypothetical protein